MKRMTMVVVVLALVMGLGGSAEAALVAYWRLDEGSGATAQDSSGNNHHGTVIGPAWANDPDRGWCLSFDGVDDYVSVPTAADLNVSAAMTVTAWIKAQTWPLEPWRGSIVSKDDWLAGARGYCLRCGDGGRL